MEPITTWMREAHWAFAVLALLLLAALPVLAWRLARHLSRGLKDFLVSCSGAKRDVLARTPTEEGAFVGLGTAVVVTSSIATLSMIVAASQAFQGSLRLALPLGVGYGLVIFALDRFIVSIPLNPHQLAPRGDPTGVPGKRPWVVARTLASAIPRLVLSLVVGLLIAEPVLLALFDREIDTRVQAIQRQLRDDAEESVKESYPELRGDHEKDSALVTAESDVAVKKTEISETESSLNDYNERLQVAAPQDRSAVRAEVTRLGRERARLRRELTQLESEARRLAEDDRKARRQRDQRVAEGKKELAEELERARTTDGLLIRIDALHQLERDPRPYVPADTGPSSATPNAASDAATGLLGLTTLGKAIWTIRLWLVLLDILPISFKILLALRPRRPYDMVLAEEEQDAIEEAELRLVEKREERAKRLDEIAKEQARRREEARAASEEGMRPFVHDVPQGRVGEDAAAAFPVVLPEAVTDPWAGETTSPPFPPLKTPVSVTVEDLAVVVDVPEEAKPGLLRRLVTLVSRKVPDAQAPQDAPVPEKGRRTILRDVTFAVEPGQVVAIIGHAGAGKSTLLNALIGRLLPDGGTISYNGQRLTADSVASFRSLLGYVPQDDILHRDLALAEAMHYCAELRLPELTEDDRRFAVWRVVRQLGVTERFTDLISTLSGGERKRASIAPELLTRPPLLVLDEPTTGLDPDAERQLLLLLKELAVGGRHTVVMITHSPAALDHCDRILVLGKDKDGIGQVLCYGTGSQVKTFFGARDFATVYARVRRVDLDWRSRFRESRLYRQNVDAPVRRTLNATVPHPGPTSAAPLTQLLVLARRNINLIKRNRRYAKILMFQAPGMAALLYSMLGPGNLGAGGDARGLLAPVVVGAILMGLVNSCREIVKELPIYQRERTVGLSRNAYLAAKLVYLGALCAIQAVMLAAIFVGQDGPSRGAAFSSHAVETVLILFVATFTAVTAGLLVSALVSTDALALVTVPIILIAQLLFTGASLRVEGRPLLAQGAYVTPAYWTFSALAASNDVVRTEGKCFQPATPADMSCPARWRRQGSNVLIPLGVLVVQSVVFSFAASAALRRRDVLRT